jgi:transcription antitermination factor NusG
VIIPLPATGEVESPRAAEELAPGQKVRINSTPMIGSIGKLIALRTEQASLSNGLRVPAAMIHLENGENTIVPLANLELLV